MTIATVLQAYMYKAIAWVYCLFQTIAPTNILIRWIRRREHLKWGLPLGSALAVGYWFAMNAILTVTGTDRVTWLGLFVILFFWNAVKFAAVAVASPFQLARARYIEWWYQDTIDRPGSASRRHSSPPSSSRWPAAQ